MYSLRNSLLLLFILGGNHLFAMRVDSFSIVHTKVHLKVRNFTARQLSGYVELKLVFKTSADRVRLDLKQMQLDSAFRNDTLISANQSGESLNLLFGRIFKPGDTVNLKVHYHGTPAADPGGWGGFYFSGDYAFNLGVGFSVYPHSFGRAWMPCVDEFPMKSSYEMFIETDTDHVAACNGLLMGTQRQGDALVWHYLETVPMSAYLAAVSVSKFSVMNSTFNGMQRSFPMQVFYKASDSNKVKASFVNLPDAIRYFEESFGPQPYSKVGYNLVPFSAGAMEHAGNITFPNVYVDGTSAYDNLMAHELSHHWWGDQVTCADAGDMWLNEGWASYCEHLFNERLRGRQAYDNSILSNHLLVLRYAHVIDGQVYSLTNIPQNVTYGTHVYKKGADVVHSLRGVLGDTLFFELCKKYQRTYRLKNASSVDMRDLFRDSGGGAIAESFFNHFVLDKGFPHIIISKQVYSGNDALHLKMFTEQKPRFKTTVYENLPVEIRFYKDRKNFVDKKITVNHLVDSFEFDLPFKPVFVCLDYRGVLSDAITDRVVMAGKSGSFDLPETNCKIIVNKALDSSLIRVEHHWVGPEKFVTTYPRMSNYRYITLDGVWSDSLDMDVEMTYDGRQGSTSGNIGYLDHTLIFKSEDSLTLMYRAFPGDYWREWKDIQFVSGNKNDKAGKIIIMHAKKGDYVPAMRDISLGLNSNNSGSYFKIHPNPVQGLLTIEKSVWMEGDVLVEIRDQQGKLVYSGTWCGGDDSVKVNTASWASGPYDISLMNSGYSGHLKLVVVQ